MHNPPRGAGPRVWGVRPLVPIACALLCAGFAATLFLDITPEDRLVTGAGACLSAIATAVLLTMRQRLTAGPDGFVVRGPGGARRISWAQVVAISAPTRRHRGPASSAVELDLDDDALIVLGRTELGADPVDVAEELRRWWRPAGR